MLRRLTTALVAATTLAAGLGLAAPAQAEGRPKLRPIVFVHGFFGSGSQFETPARRFASNGYPAGHIETHEYDSTFATITREQVFAQLDTRIARLLQETGADKVDLLGHSLGTFMSQSYLSTPERAAKVAHYVNLDGAGATALPGGVPTLAVWGEGSTARAITGAKNVYLSDQAHTETVTSPETFTEAFTFFTGREPRTTSILPEPPGQVKLSGRAVLFPSNVGAANRKLAVYEVDGRTGERLRSRPVATYDLTGDGSWGPFRARGTAHYEFELTAATGKHHVYFQPFRRTDRLVRLLTAEANTGLDAITEKSDKHVNLSILRNKEWWGDQGDGSDTLSINGTNVLNAATAPRTKRAIAVFAYDAAKDGVSHPEAAIPALSSLPFMAGVDLFVPATPAGETVKLSSVHRGGRTDVVNVPNLPSSTDRISVQFNDYSQRGFWGGVPRLGT
jgi:pimeloyl-ACP methyl ester carboxylesterase